MSVPVLIILAIAIVVIALIIVRRPRRPDGVAEFQRQIDALSPEARRPVVDKVQQLEVEPDQGGDEPERDRKGRDGS